MSLSLGKPRGSKKDISRHSLSWDHAIFNNEFLVASLIASEVGLAPREKTPEGPAKAELQSYSRFLAFCFPDGGFISFSTSEKRLTAARHLPYDANSNVSESLLTRQTDIYRPINQSQATNLVIDTLYTVDV